MAMFRPSLEYGCEVRNTNKCQAKMVGSIQLRAFKYILGCFITHCNEPMHANSALKNLRYRRDLHKLK